VLIHGPKLLLMDEPFGALEALTRAQMKLGLLRIRAETGATILFMTHGIAVAVFHGDCVVAPTGVPARMADDIAVSLPQPRTLALKTTSEVGEDARRIYARIPSPARGRGSG
jgi:NitT/TauT family transport system ATP-binding protein